VTQTECIYVDVFGSTAVDSADDTLTVEKQGGTLIFTQQNLWKSPPTCSGTFYFALADVAVYHAAVKDGAYIAWLLKQMSYGSSQFGLLNCNGYHLAFRQQA
jgi:hypothetical protein